jgi:putative sterol carrier protein
MPPTLPTDADAWADRLQAAINDREAFAAAAAGFEATFRFEVLPDDAYPGDPVALTVVVSDGACVAARGHDRDADYDFVLRGPYLAWKDLLAGDIDVSDAVMGGRFDLEGPTTTLLQRREAVAELVRAARSVDVEYAY